MKSVKKMLAASIATIALSAAVISGSTYAIFTSKESTNIAVTAGKVSITADASLTAAYSYDWDANAEGDVINNAQEVSGTYTFTNGGTAGLEDGILTLTNITPGDYVKVTINITNYSNVATKYMVKISDKEGKLADALSVTGEGTDGWVALDAATDATNGTAVTTDVVITIGLGKETVGDDYQELEGSIEIIVYAIQGNADGGTFLANLGD